MDEPFKGLDIETRSTVIKVILNSILKSKRTLIIITHSPEEAELVKAATILHREFMSLHKTEFSDIPIDAFGPFEAPVYRVENRYRMRMVVKCVLNKKSRALFSRLLHGFSKSGIRGLSLSVDFNPSNL
jgi:ABC-type nitrate/sulfonate/bicarbonate transport system ATPase subunit